MSSCERSRTTSSCAGLLGGSSLEAYHTLIRPDLGCARLPSRDYRKSATASLCCCHHRCWSWSFITAIVLMLRCASASSKAKDHLVRPTLSRHACQQTRRLQCATFNVHSLANKVDVISQCWQDWMSLASLRRGMKMPTTFRFVACALPVCRCWSVLVPFGRGRKPTTSSTKIMAE